MPNPPAIPTSGRDRADDPSPAPPPPHTPNPRTVSITLPLVGSVLAFWALELVDSMRPGAIVCGAGFLGLGVACCIRAIRLTPRRYWAVPCLGLAMTLTAFGLIVRGLVFVLLRLS